MGKRKIAAKEESRKATTERKKKSRSEASTLELELSRNSKVLRDARTDPEYRATEQAKDQFRLPAVYLCFFVNAVVHQFQLFIRHRYRVENPRDGVL